MTRTHARTATIVLLVVAMLAIAVPASAGRSVERPVREKLSGYVVGIEYAPNFPAHAGDTVRARCECYKITASIAFMRGMAFLDDERIVANVVGTYIRNP